MNGTRSDLEIAVFDEEEGTDLDVTAGHIINDAEQGVQPAIADPDEAWGNIYGTLEEESGMAFEPFQVAGLGTAGIGAAIRALRGSTMKGIGEAVTSQAARELAERTARTAAEEGSGVLRGLPMKGIKETAEVVVEEAKGGVVTGVKPKPKEGPPGPGQFGGPKYIEEGGINVTRHHEGATVNRGKLYQKYADDPEAAIQMIESAERVAEIYDEFAKMLGLADVPKPRTLKEIEKRVTDSPFKALADEISGKAPTLLGSEASLALRNITTTMLEQADDLMVRVAGGDTTPETLAKLAQTSEASLAFTALAKRNASGLSAALNSHRIISKSLEGNGLEALLASVRASRGSPDALVMMSQAYVAKKALGVPPSAAMKQALKKVTWMHAAIDLYKSNQLSSLATHAANFGASMALNAFRAGLTIPTAVAIGTAKRAAGKVVGTVVPSAQTWGADSITGHEAEARIAASVVGLFEGIKNAWKVITDNQSVMETLERNLGTDSKVDSQGAIGIKLRETLPEGVAAPLEAVSTMSFRLLKAGDEVTRTIAYREEEVGLAVRQTLREGLEPGTPEYAARLNDIVADPTNEKTWINERAVAHSREQALQDRSLGGGIIGKLARSVTMLSHDFPLLGLIAPYVTTPSNIPIYVMEHSPLAPLTARWRAQFAKGGAEADIAIAKAVLGTSALAYVYTTFYATGKITGSGPENQEQKNALYKLGWQPWSIMIGDDKLASLNRLQPATGAVLGLAAALDKAKYSKEQHDAARIAWDAAIALGDQMLDSTFMQSFNSFLEIFTKGDPMGGSAKFLGKTLENFIPYLALFASMARGYEAETGQPISTPTKQPKPGFSGSGSIQDSMSIAWEQAEARIPGARSSLNPKRHWDGEPVMPVGGMIAATMSPVTVTRIKKDPETLELAHNGVSIRQPTPLLTVAGVTVNLMDFDRQQGKVFDLYTKTIGEARREMVSELLGDSGYNDLTQGPKGERAEQLSKAIEAGTELGKARFLETFAEAVKANPKKFTEFAQYVGSEYEEFVTTVMEGRHKAPKQLTRAPARFTAKGTPTSEPIKPLGF